MAQLYMGDLISGERYMATARGPASKYGDMARFKAAVNAWLAEQGTDYRWSGHYTHTRDLTITYYYTVRIADDQARTLFALRWS